MKQKEQLTNEDIGQKFENQFDLVNYAISLASSLIKTGRDPYVKTHTENPALQILEEITAGKDQGGDTVDETIFVSEINQAQEALAK